MALILAYRHHDDPWPFIIIGFLALLFVLFWFLKFGAFVRKAMGKPEMENVWSWKNLQYATISALVIWVFILFLYWLSTGKPMF